MDYNLTSRMGNEAQFQAMVETCRNAGVKVYVDAVINHMTGQGSLSYGGVNYTHFSYPGLYTTANFHQKGTDCPSASGGIEDFNNLIQVRKCELLGLADLRTETSYVRDTLAAYLNKLIGYGVSGFRVDAAKHIGQPDLAAIASRLHRTETALSRIWPSRCSVAVRACCRRWHSPLPVRCSVWTKTNKSKPRSRATQPSTSAASRRSRSSARSPGFRQATRR